MTSVAIAVPKVPHLRRNYIAFVLDGGLFAGGMAFIAADTVLPAAMHELGASNQVIAFAPVLGMVGFLWPQLLVAHRIEGMRNLRGAVLLGGFAQRLPYLAAGLILLWAGTSHPQAATAALLLAPFLSGTCGGLMLGAYMRLNRRMIPAERRSSNFAMRALITTPMGLVAAWTIHHVLAAHPGVVGYALLHLIAFVVLMLSLWAMSWLREPPVEQAETATVPRTMRENLASLPSILRQDAGFRAYLWLKLLLAPVGVVMPFLALWAIERTGSGVALLGTLVGAQTAGTIAGNLAAAWLGDRRGPAVPLALGAASIALVMLAVPFTSGVAGFVVLFALLAFGTATNQVSFHALSMAIAPPARLPTYVSLSALLSLPATLAAAWLGGLLRDLQVPLAMAAVVVALPVGAAVVLGLRAARYTR